MPYVLVCERCHYEIVKRGVRKSEETEEKLKEFWRCPKCSSKLQIKQIVS